MLFTILAFPQQAHKGERTMVSGIAAALDA